ncbi:MAG: tetratricopeptide repeat protein [Acidimicrobiia bacterium]
MLVALGGCALKSDVVRLEQQVATLEARTARQDSARALQLNEVINLQQDIMDSLAAGRRALAALHGDIDGDLYSIQQQLVQVQALTGQSQQRLTDLRTQLDTRGAQIAEGNSVTADVASVPSADQIYEASLAQLRRGSLATARLGFQELLRSYADDRRAPDALYFIGESYATTDTDSSAAYYQQVVDRFPGSSRVPTALYKLALLAEQRGDRQAALDAYNRVVQQHPSSDAAELARDRLIALGQ